VATPTPSKLPINPFLANDPNQKAKRLARALVSDMVAYHPQKRDEGMRAGTLKQLFQGQEGYWYVENRKGIRRIDVPLSGCAERRSRRGQEGVLGKERDCVSGWFDAPAAAILKAHE
jgi:hypothetical protein